MQNSWIQDGRIQDGCHHQVTWEGMSLSQIELVWFRVRVFEWIWEKITRWVQDGSVLIQHGRIQDGCHHQVESEWISEVYFVQNDWIQDGQIQDGCHHQVDWEWIREVFLCKMVESKMSEFKMAAIIKLSQNEWVKFFLCKWWGRDQSWQVCFFYWNGENQSWQVWVSMRGKTKMVESKMAKLKKAAIIKLSENEWVWVRLK